jgi:hypothetical protein
MKKIISDPCVEQFFAFLEKVFQNKVNYSDLKYRVNENINSSSEGPAAFSFTSISFQSNTLDPYAFSIVILNGGNSFFSAEAALSLQLSDHKALGSEKEIILQLVMPDDCRARLVMPGLEIDYTGDNSFFDGKKFNLLINEMYANTDLMELLVKIMDSKTLKPKTKHSKKVLKRAQQDLKIMPAY